MGWFGLRTPWDRSRRRLPASNSKPKRRTLSLESLERRELLSATAVMGPLPGEDFVSAAAPVATRAAALASSGTFFTLHSAQWDVARGGMNFRYTAANDHVFTTLGFNLYWSDGSREQKIPGTLGGGVGTHSVFVPATTLGTPPSWATELRGRLVLDGKVRPEGFRTLSYTPTIALASDKLGVLEIGADGKTGSVGRFLAGIPTPNETITVRLSNDLVAMQRGGGNLKATLGGQTLALARVGQTTQFTATFSPGTLTEPGVVDFSVTFGGRTLAAKVNVEVVDPDWLPETATAKFNAATKSYVITAPLINIASPKLPGFNFPDVWFAKSSNTSFDLQADLKITAPLRGFAKGQLVATGQISFLGGTTEFNKKVDVPLDQQKLQPTVQPIELPFTASSSVNLLPGKSYQIGSYFRIQPELQANLKFTGKLTVKLGPNGALNSNASEIQLRVAANQITGSLGPSLRIPSVLDRLLEFMKYASFANALISFLQTNEIIPSIALDFSAKGNAWAEATFRVNPNGLKLKSPVTGQFKLTPTVSVTASWLQNKKELFNSQQIVTALAVDTQF